MKARAWVVVVTVALTAGAAGAQQRAPRTLPAGVRIEVDGERTRAREETPGQRLRSADDPAEVRAAMRDLFLHTLARAEQSSSAGSVYHGYEPETVAVPAGDLDGDGIGDAVLRSRDTRALGLIYETVVRGLKGTDGSTLWERTFSGIGSAFPARVGPDAETGVIVASLDCTCVGLVLSAVYVPVLTVAAISSAGDIVWQRTFRGAAVYTEVLVEFRYPFISGVLHSGGATNALVGMLTEARSIVPGARVLDAEVIAGVDGGTAATSSDTIVGWSMVYPSADVTGDGGADYVVALQPLVDDHRLIARSGSDGSILWDQPTQPLYGLEYGDVILVPAGDVDADGRTDVAVTGGAGFYGYYGICYEEYFEGCATSEILSGATGDGILAVAGAFARPLGDIDNVPGDEVGTVDIFVRSSAIGFRYEAGGVAGPSYLREFSIPIPDCCEAYGVVELYPLAGDLDADGAGDAAHRIAVADFSADTYTIERGAVSGRTGSKMWDGRPGLPVRASLDGAGEDLLDVRATYEDVSVRAIDGASGADLWSTLIAIDDPWVYPVTGGDVTGDGRAEAFLTVGGWNLAGFYTRTFVLDGSSGSLLWAT